MKKILSCIILVILLLPIKVLSENGETTKEIEAAIEGLADIAKQDNLMLDGCSLFSMNERGVFSNSLSINDFLEQMDLYYTIEAKVHYINDLKSNSELNPKSGSFTKIVCTNIFNDFSGGFGRVDYTTIERKITSINQISETKYKVLVEEVELLHGDIAYFDLDGTYYYGETIYRYTYIYTYYLEKQSNGEWKLYRFIEKEYKREFY